MVFEQTAPPQPRPAVGVRAFLIADVRGYTRFTQEYGDAAATRLALRFAELVHEELAGTEGELLGLRGDEAAVAFGSVRQALRTALALQDRFARERAADPTLPLRVGVGLDAGEAVAVTDGYRGMALNVAARLCAVAPAGTILLTESLAHLAGTVEEVAYLEHGRLALKGLAAPVHVLELLPAHFVALVAAPDDGAHGERLREDLRAQGVALWAVPPISGAAEDEADVRSGVRASHAVLLLGTPHAVRARPVKTALGIAHLYQRPIVAVWVAGEDGEMPDLPGEPIDLCGERYGPGVAAVVAALAQAEVPSAPLLPALLQDVAPRNPYKGLRAFRSADAGDFFGREGLIGELVAAVRAYTQPGMTRFLAVVGPSGSGKSSVVLAGLLPRLQGGAVPGSAGWVYLDPLVPGTHPLEALAAVLNNALPGSSLTALHADLDASERSLHTLARRLVPDPHGRVVLVVDQAEELFTLTTDDDERRQFIDLLVTAAAEPRGPLVVVLTLRADFYDRPMSYIQLGRLVDAQSRAVLPLEPAALRAAIEGPAALPDVGLHFAGDLVGDLLYEVRDQVGALPLLQFTLDQLYERRDGHLLTEAAYLELGGVRGALARHAEATYMGLPDEEYRILARALFLRLIEPGTSAAEATRRRAPLGELELVEAAQTARMHTVAETFIAARLLTATESRGTTTLEVSHEALIREWGRLGAWVEEAREDVRLQGRLSADAAEWEQHARPADSLYRGTVLAEALGWAERNTPSALEARFLDAGVGEAQRQAVAERERQTRELALTRRAATRLRALVGVLAVFLLVAAGLVTFAFTNADQARRAQRQAETAREVALSGQLAAQATRYLSSQRDLSLLLSMEADRIDNTADARRALLQGIADDHMLTSLHGPAAYVDRAVFSPDGRLLAVASDDGTIRLWDARTWLPLGAPLQAENGAVNSIAFSPDGRLLVAGGENKMVRVWDVAHGHVLDASLPNLTADVYSVAFSPDGKTIATGGSDNVVRLWDVAHRQQRAAPAGHADPVTSLAFSPNGAILASGSADQTIRLWDSATGLPLQFVRGLSTRDTLYGHTGSVSSLAFTADGQTLVSAGQDGTIRLWNMSHGQGFSTILTTSASPVVIAVSAHAPLLAAGMTDGSIQLWDLAHRQPMGSPLSTAGAIVSTLTFSPDGKTLVSGRADGTLTVWDLADRHPLGEPLPRHTEPVLRVIFSPNGKILASVAADFTDATIHLWEMSRPGVPSLILHTLVPGPNYAGTGAFSPDGRIFVSGSTDSTVRLWDVVRGQPLGPTFVTQTSGVNSVAFNPTTSILASGAGDGTVQFWAIANRRRGLLRPLGLPVSGHTAAIESIAFSPDGTLLASAGADYTIRLWDVPHRRPIGAPLRGHTSAVISVAFSPDGRTLASVSWDGTLRLWNVASHRALGAALASHLGDLTSVAFSPDGTIVATGGSGLQLWDVADRQPLGTALPAPSEGVSAVAFSPNGATLASGSANGTVSLWPGDVTAWQVRACHIANRNLTRQEWQQYLGDLPYHKTCPSLPAGS